ncbi:endo alpha-1,4 polygalactosaminidase [Bacillus rubiinfantis]|uniref:endo alpha-1,4 polygalactosaminidase n=1 Tax=Bacillus rubiinfantis TaxID=1499680 RepID=UPI000693DF00|nr:endo alpha-1,4 polygalactosaminidase [Bacillus rubiinfantis]
MFRKTSLILTCVILLLLTSCYPTYAKWKNPLLDVKNYKIYYGNVSDAKVKELSRYDMVIIEPHEITKERVAKLKANGTIVLGYLSIMELQQWDKAFTAKVKESNYLKVNYKKVYIEDWDTYLMDITNLHYQQLLFAELKEEIIAKKFDGVLLDTVGDIDDFYGDNKKVATKLRTGYGKLLQTITKKYPKLVFVQNWGFDTYKFTSKKYVDGILWENYDKERLKDSKWGQKWIKYFQTAKRKEHKAVFTVTPDNSSTSYSKKQGFVPFKHKTSIYN